MEFPYCEGDKDAVESMYGSMTLRERIGQHLMVGIERAGGGLTDDSEAKLVDYALGGVFIGPPVGIALDDPVTTGTFVHNARKLAYETSGVPLFVSLDQEGGPNAVVNSLTGGTDTIGSMPIGATMDPTVAWEQFDIMAREIAALGFNMDLGPVLDTLLSTRNGNLNTRPFGPDPDLNASCGVLALAALQQQRVIAVVKHFPGDGLTDGNTHKEHVVVEEDRDFLEATILKPFRAAVEAGCDGVMTIPAGYAALDPERSAITSRAINTGLLREEMGFSGLIVTDSLGMAGAKLGLNEGELPGMEALKAGADVLLFVNITLTELEELVSRIEAELASGAYSEEEFEVSTKRILQMKQRYCLFERPVVPDEDELKTLKARLARAEDRALSLAHARRAVVLLHDTGVLPLTGKKVLYVGPATVFSDPGSGWLNMVDQTFGDALRAHDPGVESVTYFLPVMASQEFASVADKAKAADLLVVGTLQGRFSLCQQQLLEWILEGIDKPVIHVCLGVPFDYAQSRERAAAALALMGSRSVMVEAGAAVLYGKAEAQGTMLFDLEKVTVDGNVGDPDDPAPEVNRCEELQVDCSGGGMCVDIGTEFGCVCHPNWHPSQDGLDCVPDGSGDGGG